MSSPWRGFRQLSTYGQLEDADWTLDWNRLWTGLDWTGLDWTGLDWSGVEWTGLDFFFIGQLENLDWTLDWTGLASGLDWIGLNFFLGGGVILFGGGGVGGLDWSLCLTHGRHVSLES